jgi:dTDP-4-dehydrorhamnose 3,5-epimerase
MRGTQFEVRSCAGGVVQHHNETKLPVNICAGLRQAKLPSHGWSCGGLRIRPLGIRNSKNVADLRALPKEIVPAKNELCFTETGIVDAWVIDPSPHEDERGRFMRLWCAREFSTHGLSFVPVQANMGFSLRKGTLRGIHFQEPPALEAKLVRCTKGAIFDVVLDLRPGSPSYGKWRGAELTPENGRMLYIPQQCGHGYQTLVDDTEMYYMASEYYTPSAACGVRFDDPSFNIQWPLVPTVISEQDRNWALVESSQRAAHQVNSSTP